MTKLLMLGVALFGMQAVPAAPDALAPSGKWGVEFENATCTLSRKFGLAPAEVTLAMRSTPGNPLLHFYLLRAAGGAGKAREGDVEITLAPSGQKATSQFFEGVTAKGDRVAEMYVQRSALGDLGAAKAISFQLAKDAPVRVRPDYIAAALRTQAACEDDLAKAWGYDPIVLNNLSKQPVPINSPQNWITDDDYPPEALRSRWSGDASVRLAVGVDGKVLDCAVTESTGHAVLDETACARLKERARFQPALDKDGKPVAVPWASRFSWRLPR